MRKKNRFFFKAPYHHHQQAAMSERQDIISIYHNWLEKLGFIPKHQFYKNFTKKEIDSKVIWQNHIKAIWFLVIAFLIYFKVR